MHLCGLCEPAVLEEALPVARPSREIHGDIHRSCRHDPWATADTVWMRCKSKPVVALVVLCANMKLMCLVSHELACVCAMSVRVHVRVCAHTPVCARACVRCAVCACVLTLPTSPTAHTRMNFFLMDGFWRFVCCGGGSRRGRLRWHDGHEVEYVFEVSTVQISSRSLRVPALLSIRISLGIFFVLLRIPRLLSNPLRDLHLAWWGRTLQHAAPAVGSAQRSDRGERWWAGWCRQVRKPVGRSRI